MKEKITTKTIIISIVALLVLGAAIAGAVVFLKDSGEVSATGNVQNVTLTETENKQTEEKNEQILENINVQDNNEEINTNINNNKANNDANQVENSNQDEPAPTTVEREKTVLEKTALGWSNIGFNSEINNLEINYNNIEYSVEYYFEGKLCETSKIGGNQKGKEVNSYEDKIKEGYLLDKVENLPLVISEKEDENIIKVYYKKDDTQTKNLKYTVKYYLDNIEQVMDRVIVNKTVWINAENTIDFDSNLLDKNYTGYKKVRINPETIGETAEDGLEISVYYEKDDSQTKELKYTVKYYLDNVEQVADRVIVNKNVWINAENILDIDNALINKSYIGYRKVRTNPETIGTTVENNSEISIYYEKESYGYTIFYYKDSIDGENLLGRITGKEKFEATVTADTTKFIPSEGYVFDGIAPSMIIGVDSKSNILNVVYRKVNNLSYTINYLEKGTNKVLQSATVVPNQEFNKVIKISDLTIPSTLTYNSKEYTYSNKFTTNQEPENIGKIVISTNLSLNVINLYYERPEIRAEKTSSIVTNATQNGKAYAGDEITYTIKVWNEGSGDKQVRIEDTAPNGTTIISNSENKNYGNTLIENGKITWTVNVPANTSKNDARTLTFKVIINSDASGTIKNTAIIDGTDGPNDGDGYSIIKPADITVSKESRIIDTNKNDILEYGEKIVYTIKATNSGEDVGTVTIKDKDLKTLIDSNLVELLDKTGYTGTNEQLVNELANNGISLIVQGNSSKTLTYTVKVIANAGKTIKNSVEAIGGKVDDSKKETINKVEKETIKTENTETIKGKNIVIAIDLSASMNDIINGTSKLEAAKDAAQKFINKIFENDPNGASGTKLSLVTFNFSEEEKDQYSTETNSKYVGTKVFTYGKNNKTIVTNKKEAQEINSEIKKISLEANLGTNIGAGLIKSQQQINVLKSNNNNGNVIIFLGDGRPEAGGNENTETAIDKKATEIKNSGTEIYTIGFGLHTQVDKWCPLLFNMDCKKSHYYKGLLRYHKEDVHDTDAIRILRNMASGKTSAEKDKYANSSSNAQSLIDAFDAISKNIAISNIKDKSSNGKVKLADTIYADSEHPIIIKVNGKVDTTLNELPSDTNGKVIKEKGKYYLDLTKFEADDNVSITYFSK